MAYILNDDRPLNSYQEWQSQWSKYCDYLESVRNHLPIAAYNFASAPWHYDFSDHHAPHDGWVEEIIMREPATGARNEHRSLEIVVKLFAGSQRGFVLHEIEWSCGSRWLIECSDVSYKWIPLVALEETQQEVR